MQYIFLILASTYSCSTAAVSCGSVFRKICGKGAPSSAMARRVWADETSSMGSLGERLAADVCSNEAVGSPTLTGSEDEDFPMMPPPLPRAGPVANPAAYTLPRFRLPRAVRLATSCTQWGSGLAARPGSERPSPLRDFAVGMLSRVALGPRRTPDASYIGCDAGELRPRHAFVRAARFAVSGRPPLLFASPVALLGAHAFLGLALAGREACLKTRVGEWEARAVARTVGPIPTAAKLRHTAGHGTYRRK